MMINSLLSNKRYFWNHFTFPLPENFPVLSQPVRECKLNRPVHTLSPNASNNIAMENECEAVITTVRCGNCFAKFNKSSKTSVSEQIMSIEISAPNCSLQ